MLKVANSVISASRITGVLPVANGGTGVTTSTGTGNTVLSAAPTLSGDVNLSTGNLVIGTAGKGIDFTVTSSGSGTMTSELLSDYEEGTFDPRFSFATGGDTFTYNARIASYTKVGRLVTINLLVDTSAKGAGTGDFSLTNLPFAAAGYASTVPRTVGIANTGPISAYTYSGQSQLYFFTVSTLGVETQITNTSVGAAVTVVMTLSYITT